MEPGGLPCKAVALVSFRAAELVILRPDNGMFPLCFSFRQNNMIQDITTGKVDYTNLQDLQKNMYAMSKALADLGGLSFITEVSVNNPKVRRDLLKSC